MKFNNLKTNTILTKTIKPMLTKENTNCSGKVSGALIEYRLFGILFYKKELFAPEYYGVGSCEYQIRF